MNSYQKSKAKRIAAVLLLAAAQSSISISELPALAARMSHEQWVSVSLQAGVAVAEMPARIFTIALLQRLA